MPCPQVFCTPVMVSVAKSFEAPIKLLFRRLDAGPDKAPFSMLGLGDIVIPGFFVALMLRMDVAKGRRGRVLDTPSADPPPSHPIREAQ